MGQRKHSDERVISLSALQRPEMQAGRRFSRNLERHLSDSSLCHITLENVEVIRDAGVSVRVVVRYDSRARTATVQVPSRDQRSEAYAGAKAVATALTEPISEMLFDAIGILGVGSVCIGSQSIIVVGCQFHKQGHNSVIYHALPVIKSAAEAGAKVVVKCIYDFLCNGGPVTEARKPRSSGWTP